MTHDLDIAQHAIADARQQAEITAANAAREHEELGTSLRIANEERQRLTEMLEAALDLLEPVYGGRTTCEMVVCSRVQTRAAGACAVAS